MYFHTFNSDDSSNCKILILNNLIGQTESQFESHGFMEELNLIFFFLSLKV